MRSDSEAIRTRNDLDMKNLQSAGRVLVYGGGAHNWKSAVEQHVDPQQIVICTQSNQIPENLDDIACLIGYQFPDRLLGELNSLQWIQALSVGIDKLARHPLIPEHVRITNTRGLYSREMAEYILWAMLTLHRKFHVNLHNQSKRKWKQVFGSGLMGKSVCVIGLGSVGLEVANLSSKVGMRVKGLVRDDSKSRDYANVETVMPASRIKDAVTDVDALVICAPLTDTTRSLIDDNVIRSMQKSAIIINVSRSEVIDGRCVFDALREDRLAGAALDVFDREPLRRWDPLWKCRNLLITPHSSGLTSQYKTRVADLIAQNMLRFLQSEPLLNLVDRNRGY